jgi:hypothetical protein
LWEPFFEDKTVHFGQDFLPFRYRHAPDRSLNGQENVVAKNGPFSLTFCQIVALMLRHRSVLAGLLLVAILFPPLLE